MILPVRLIYPSQHIGRLLSIINTGTKSSRIVGGSVRNIILGEQVNDIDIATELLPEALIGLLKDANIKYYDKGIKFGTVRVIIKGEVFEITTLRRDIKCYGRYADVKFSTSYYEDAQRRDFTINALSYSYQSNLVYDYFNGIQHLYDRKVVFIGDPNIRIQEDVLRILRFFRFSAYYAHDLDVGGYIACAENACKLVTLSIERIIHELDKIINAPNSVYILNKMQEISIFKYINLQLQLNIDILNDIQIAIKNRDYTPNIDTLYALLFSNNKTEKIKINISKLHFSKKRINKIIKICAFLHQCKVGNPINIIKKYWVACEPDIEDYINLARVLEYISKDDSTSLLELTHNSLVPKLPVNGHDLLNLGVPAQNIRRVIAYLNDAWVNSSLTLTREHMINLVLNYNYKS